MGELIIPRNKDGIRPGFYCAVEVAIGLDVKWSAVVQCPLCRQRMSLANHEISPQGKVSPSIGHPNNTNSCAWHPASHSILECWEEVLATPLKPYDGVVYSCEKCGYQSRGLGGWGTWSGGKGIICPPCIKEHTGAK